MGIFIGPEGGFTPRRDSERFGTAGGADHPGQENFKNGDGWDGGTVYSRLFAGRAGVFWRRAGKEVRFLEAYLDNSATTRCYEEVKDIVVRLMTEDYAKSFFHAYEGGRRRTVSERSGGQDCQNAERQRKKRFISTSGGTESDNWALIGSALANQRQGKHIITTAIEHPAVSAPLAFLEEQGFSVTRLGVDREGKMSLEELEQAITSETILVSVMFVNNEIGAVQPIAEIGDLIKKKNPRTIFHVDAIQAYGKYRILPKKMKIDLLSVSGHKIHGPKGIGFLYINEKQRFPPIFTGEVSSGGCVLERIMYRGRQVLELLRKRSTGIWKRIRRICRRCGIISQNNWKKWMM